MNETSPRSTLRKRFATRTVAVGIFAACGCVLLIGVWFLFRKEILLQQAIRAIRASGGEVLRWCDVPEMVEGSEGMYLIRVEADQELQYLNRFAPFVSLILGGGVTDQGIVHLAGAPEFQDLVLANAAITDAGLEGIVAVRPNIRFLSLLNTQITDAGLQHLQRLPKLRDLKLAGCAFHDAGLAHLAGLKIDFLNLDHTAVTGSGLPSLRCLPLTHLSLIGLPVDDAALGHLAAMPRLTCIDISHTRVTPEAVKRLKCALPRCQVVTGSRGKAIPPE